MFGPNHRGNEASIYQSPNPPFLTYQCFHNTCNHTWKEAKRQISSTDSLKKVMSNYDPDWKPPVPAARGSALTGQDNGLALAEMEITPRESLAFPGSEIPEPEEMEYFQFCRLGKKDRITFVPMFMAKYLGAYLHPIRFCYYVFWIYRGGVWRELLESTIGNICVRAMGNDAQPRRTNDSIALLAQITDFKDKDWEDQGELINCLNGMVDPRGLKLLPHSPDYGSRAQVPCRFIPEETEYDPPELWEKTLKEIFPEPDGAGADKIHLPWQYFGYMLLPDCRYEASLWLLGTGQNGKGTITETMQVMIGEENCSNLQLSELKDPRFNLYHLQNKMLNISCETSERDPLSMEIFKKMVSGERVTTERKYGRKFDFTPSVKFVIGLNAMPVIPDKTEGFGRRVQLIRCDQKFKEGKNRDPDRKANLREQASLDGVFTWAASGLAGLLTTNGFVKDPGKSKLDGFEAEIRTKLQMGVPRKRIAADYGTTAGNLRHWLRQKRIEG